MVWFYRKRAEYLHLDQWYNTNNWCSWSLMIEHTVYGDTLVRRMHSSKMDLATVHGTLSDRRYQHTGLDGVIPLSGNITLSNRIVFMHTISSYQSNARLSATKCNKNITMACKEPHISIPLSIFGEIEHPVQNALHGEWQMFTFRDRQTFIQNEETWPVCHSSLGLILTCNLLDSMLKYWLTTTDALIECRSAINNAISYVVGDTLINYFSICLCHVMYLFFMKFLFWLAYLLINSYVIITFNSGYLYDSIGGIFYRNRKCNTCYIYGSCTAAPALIITFSAFITFTSATMVTLPRGTRP